MGGVGDREGRGAFSFNLVVVCSAPRKTLTRVWGGARWGVELGFSVILVVVCSALCKTLTRVWGGAGVARWASQSFWW